MSGKDGATLYLRGLPERVVRGSKVRAAQRGITLTAYVTELLERAVAGEGEDGEPHAPWIDADLAWYREQRERLAHRYGGEYLAVVDREIVDHDPEFAPLARRVRQRYGDRPVLMPRCIAGGRVVRLPSPRLGHR